MHVQHSWACHQVMLSVPDKHVVTHILLFKALALIIRWLQGHVCGLLTSMHRPVLSSTFVSDLAMRHSSVLTTRIGYQMLN